MTLVREFNLYLTAGKSIPLVINVNQFDSGEQWVFTLYKEDGTQYTPSTGAIVGIKSDGLGIINSGSVVDGKVVINETEQMTAAAGKAVFELLIDSQTHGTANFVVLVEPKPGNNADLSESDLSLLQEAIDATSPLPTGGTVGQVLTKTAQGSAWSDAGTPTQAQVAEAVSDWADEHITVETGVVIDTSLSVAGAAADAKKTGDEISDLKSNIQQNADDISAEETRAKAEEERLEELFTTPTQEAVDNWLNEHPEATTTVQDGSLTESKFSDTLKLKAINDYVTPEMFGAKGDGTTDDTGSFNQMNGNKVISLKNGATYYLVINDSYILNTDLFIDGNGATIKILFTGQNAPRFIYSANVIKVVVKNCNFDVSVAQGTSRSRVFDCNSGTVILENVRATISKVPSTEKVSFAEVNKLFVRDCNIVNNSQCTTDGGTLWAKGTDSELLIENSYISGNHNDEVIANYGSGNLRTKISNCKIITSSKITLRALSDTTAKSNAELNDCDITYTENVMALDIGGKSTNNISLSHCVFHGTVSYILETSTFTENPIACYVNDCNFDDITYTRFVDASMAISLFMDNTNVGYLMSNPSTFRLKKIALNNCHVAETFLIDATSSATSETLSIDLWLNNCVIDTVHYDSKTRTADNPHLMINAFIGGNHINRFI